MIGSAITTRIARSRRPGSASRSSWGIDWSPPMWFRIRWVVSDSQPCVSQLSTRPFSGIGVGNTTSKAEMRSVDTIRSSRSVSRYVSRTLPREWSGSGSDVVRMAVICPNLPSPASGGGGCYGLLEPEALERHVEMTKVERWVEELRQLVGGEPLAHLRGLPDDQLEVLSSIERAERGPLHDTVGILPGHALLDQRQ